MRLPRDSHGIPTLKKFHGNLMSRRCHETSHRESSHENTMTRSMGCVVELVAYVVLVCYDIRSSAATLVGVICVTLVRGGYGQPRSLSENSVTIRAYLEGCFSFVTTRAYTWRVAVSFVCISCAYPHESVLVLCTRIPHKLTVNGDN